jgi:ribosome biogenesis GTPase
MPQFEARVSLSHGDRARILINHIETEALVAGALLFSQGPPVTGDWVLAHEVEPGLALIEQILPRRTQLTRRAAGTAKETQTLAANVDLAFLVSGLDLDFNPRRLERYLVLAREGGVTPVSVLNKADTVDSLLPALEALKPIAANTPILPISALTGQGVDAIEAFLSPNTTAVLLGSSGAGKSTLLNRLTGALAEPTAPVRHHDHRGRHTTTHRHLLELPNGATLIDTPGLREIQLTASPDAIDAVFDDIAELARNCRFLDCTHTVEPGCAVRDAANPERLVSYHKLAREAARHLNPQSEKQRWRAIHKAVRNFHKLRRDTTGED